MLKLWLKANRPRAAVLLALSVLFLQSVLNQSAAEQLDWWKIYLAFRPGPT